MKMFKKALAALLTLCMVFSLAACGGSSKEAPAETKDPASTEAPATEEEIANMVKEAQEKATPSID